MFSQIIHPQIIHDGLIQDVEEGLEGITLGWSAGTFEPFMIGWSKDALVADDGTPIDITWCRLHPEVDKQREIAGFVKRINPLALLLCEQVEGAVRVTFETGYGTRSWSYPIEEHGVDRVLGAVVVANNTHAIGILWKPKN